MHKQSDKIDLTPAQRKQIVAFVQHYLPNTEVWAYGSRVKFTAKSYSDLDLVVFASQEQELQVAQLQEALEESDLPFRVDLFIWNEVPASFRKNIEADQVVLVAAEPRE